MNDDNKQAPLLHVVDTKRHKGQSKRKKLKGYAPGVASTILAKLWDTRDIDSVSEEYELKSIDCLAGAVLGLAEEVRAMRRAALFTAIRRAA